MFRVNVWDQDYGSVFVVINATLKTMFGGLNNREAFVYKSLFSIRIPRAGCLRTLRGGFEGLGVLAQPSPNRPIATATRWRAEGAARSAKIPAGIISNFHILSDLLHLQATANLRSF